MLFVAYSPLTCSINTSYYYTISVMEKFDQILLSILSDLFVNLAAGWFGAVIIISPTLRLFRRANLIILTADITFAIVSLTFAFTLRKLI